MSGGAGPIPFRGRLFVSSGYGFGPQMPGNLLMAFEVESGAEPTKTPVGD